MLDKSKASLADFFHMLRRGGAAARSKKLFSHWRWNKAIPIALAVIIALALFYHFGFSAPRDFDAPSVIEIAQNETLKQIAADLAADHTIRSAVLFEWTVRALGGNRSVRAGSYYFEGPQNALRIAIRLRTGAFAFAPVRVSIPEGLTVRQIGDLLAEKIAPFDEQAFLEEAAPSEGYLYPDTYFFYPREDPETIIQNMEENFQNHIDAASSTIEASGHSLHDLVVMASILVGEAGDDADRRIVSGILWRRIAMDMPLQVDAPFGYILDKPLTELTPSDLQIDSPYNTYLNKGLPPTPINNPGIEAIRAAADPATSTYLYYLSDGSGTMHYSATFAEHEVQIREYLK